MNKFKVYFLVISFVFVLFSCNKSDDAATILPIRGYSDQYERDNATIENYLKTYYIQNPEIVNSPEYAIDQDVVLKKISDNPGQSSIWSLWKSSTFRKLDTLNVERHGITYKVYYLQLRENNVNGESPSQVDEVLVSYKGYYLKDNSTTVNEVEVVDIESTFFESLIFPKVRFKLDQTIKGWSLVLPKFKTGIYDVNTPPQSAAIYQNFGAGVMFLPSGLAYFSNTTSTIPSYSPLVFSFKLYDMKRADQDEDGVLSIDEDINADGNFDNDDTDADGIPNYLDKDDDGDGYLTKNEIKINGVVPATYELILDCNGTTTGLKKHLNGDRNCR